MAFLCLGCSPFPLLALSLVHFWEPTTPPGLRHLPLDKGAPEHKACRRTEGAFQIDGKWWHLSRTWLACWILTMSCVPWGASSSMGPLWDPPPSSRGGHSWAAALGKLTEQKGLPSLASDFSHLITCFPFPVVMEKMELHHTPCSPGEALNVSNRATGDRHNRRAPCLTLDISRCKQVWAFPLWGSSITDKGEQASIVSLLTPHRKKNFI